jgi:hypothetical protein
MALLMVKNPWWLADPQERYWVETLSERRTTLGRQLHAPQADASGQPNDILLAASPTDSCTFPFTWLWTRWSPSNPGAGCR